MSCRMVNLDCRFVNARNGLQDCLKKIRRKVCVLQASAQFIMPGEGKPWKYVALDFQRGYFRQYKDDLPHAKQKLRNRPFALCQGQETMQALLYILAQNLKKSFTVILFPPGFFLLNTFRVTKLFRTGPSHDVSSNPVQWVPSDSGYPATSDTTHYPIICSEERRAVVRVQWSWWHLHWRTLKDCSKHEQDICVYSGGHQPRSKVCNTRGVKKPT